MAHFKKTRWLLSKVDFSVWLKVLKGRHTQIQPDKTDFFRHIFLFRHIVSLHASDDSILLPPTYLPFDECTDEIRFRFLKEKEKRKQF